MEKTIKIELTEKEIHDIILCLGGFDSWSIEEWHELGKTADKLSIVLEGVKT